MSVELQEHKVEIHRIFREYYLTQVSKRFENHLDFIERFSEYLKNLCNTLSKGHLNEDYAIFATSKRRLNKIVDAHYSTFEAQPIDEQFSSFIVAIDAYISTLDRRVQRPQIQERFRRQDGDSFSIRSAKFFKRLFYAISKWPEHIVNGFRKLFRKPVKRLKPWQHTVYHQRLSRFYFKEELLGRGSALMDLYYDSVAETSRMLWKLEEDFNKLLEESITKISEAPYTEIESIREAFLERKDLFDKRCSEVFEEVFDQFEDAYFKAGTVELTNNRFNPRNLKKKHDRLKRKHLRRSRGWNNTLLVLSDDWEIDLELFSIIFSAKSKFNISSNKLASKIQSGIEPVLEQLKDKIQEKVSEVESGSKSKLKNVLSRSLSELRAGLIAHFSKQSIETILAQDLPSLINEVEADIDRRINAIQTKRAVVSNFGYDKPIRTSGISYVSPFELINFESWPQFKKATQQVKVETTGHINAIVNTFQSLSQIAEFNIESAIALFDDESEGDPKAIALEGLSRTTEKITDVRTELNGFTTLVNSNLKSAIDEFNESLIKFTNNENIFDIKVRIARAMAVERSKNFRDQVIKSVKNAIPTVVKFAVGNYQRGSEWVSGIFKRYGIHADEETISTELVDFLAETENSIDKLPFVYQRLFRSQPLDDTSFFESRTKEISELCNAYNNWMKSRFAPSIVIGEKGSGLTTLLHFAIDEIGSSKEVIRISLDERILVPADIATFLSGQLGKKFRTLDDVVAFLNDGEKRIVVIENLQRLFLRKVGGFDCLIELLQLITITSRNVFWMAGCTLYAWNYLEKTMKLSEHFGYVIKLEDFDSEQIVSVINKRHQVSGYNVVFEPSSLNMNSKRFKNLDDKSKQTLLRKQYFDDLNKIAKSNISLALLYWLRSTRAVSGSTISISGLRDIDFSFLKSYGQDKLFGLTQLILHDGLSEGDFMEVSGKSSSGSRNVLFPLYDDGILVLEEAVFRINPLLYRQVVSLLRSKNIIH